jgi:hypothetical protein
MNISPETVMGATLLGHYVYKNAVNYFNPGEDKVNKPGN